MGKDGNGDIAFAAFKMRAEFGVGEGLDLELFAPTFKDFRWCAVIEAAVDFTSAAYAAAFDVSDLVLAERHRLSAVAVFLKHLVWGIAFL